MEQGIKALKPEGGTGYTGSGTVKEGETGQGEKIIDGLQLALDVAGLVPGFGEVADGINALISLLRGNYVDAALSAAAMIPFAGWAATAGKGVKYGLKAADAVETAVKHADDIVDAGEFVIKHADEAAEAVAKGVGDSIQLGIADDLLEEITDDWYGTGKIGGTSFEGAGETAKAIDPENYGKGIERDWYNNDVETGDLTTEGAGDYYTLAEKAGNVDVSSSAHQAVFYSGEGNRAQAEAFAQLNGKTTLEMTPGGKYFDDLKLFEAGSPLTKTQARDIWKILSERYAKGASGNAYGFVNGANPGSIFNTVEYPALQKNPYITNIFTEFLK